jgi:hypothetical protein
MTEESLLNRLYIAAPCNAKWEEMSGDERVRMCALCTKHVYNISDMNKREAEAFLREKGTSACARFYRRRDGTIITDDCPVGLRKFRDTIRTFWLTAAAGIGVMLAMAVATYKPGAATFVQKNETAPAELAIDIAACQKSAATAVGNVDPRYCEAGQTTAGSDWTSRAHYFTRFPVGGEVYFAEGGAASQQAYSAKPEPEQSLSEKTCTAALDWLSIFFDNIRPQR